MKLFDLEQITSWLQSRCLLLEVASNGMWSPKLSGAAATVVEIGLFDQNMDPVHCLDAFLRITMEEWTECCVWKRMPSWTCSDDSSLSAELERILVNDTVQLDVVGAICVHRTEQSILHRLLLAQMLCGVSLADDAFVVPDRGKARVISIEHHHVATLNCVDEADAKLAHTELLQEGLQADIWRDEAGTFS